jgi:hypothetical protein
MARFLQQFDAGSGDYSRERMQILGSARVEDLVEEIRRRRSSGDVSPEPPTP